VGEYPRLAFCSLQFLILKKHHRPDCKSHDWSVRFERLHDQGQHQVDDRPAKPVGSGAVISLFAGPMPGPIRHQSCISVVDPRRHRGVSVTTNVRTSRSTTTGSGSEQEAIKVKDAADIDLDPERTAAMVSNLLVVWDHD
jgi:hypothetical protein